MAGTENAKAVGSVRLASCAGYTIAFVHAPVPENSKGLQTPQFSTTHSWPNDNTVMWVCPQPLWSRPAQLYPVRIHARPPCFGARVWDVVPALQSWVVGVDGPPSDSLSHPECYHNLAVDVGYVLGVVLCNLFVLSVTVD